MRRLEKASGPSSRVVAEGAFADGASIATDGKVLVVLGERTGDIVRLTPSGGKTTIGHISRLADMHMDVEQLVVAGGYAYALIGEGIDQEAYARVVRAKLDGL